MTPPEIAAIERRLSRAAALVAVGACALFVALSPEHRAPRAALLAGLGIYALSKIIVLVLRIVARHGLWVASLCEVAALGVVGFVVWSGAVGPVTFTLVAALLLAAGVWRRRLSQPAESESP